MKKSLVSSLTERAMKSDNFHMKFESQWENHKGMFGPILESVFEENMPGKIEMNAALIALSKGEIKKSVQKLEHLKKYCETEAEHVAWLFFMGMAFRAVCSYN